MSVRLNLSSPAFVSVSAGGGGGDRVIALDSVIEFSNYPSGAQLTVTTTNTTLTNYVTGLPVGGTIQFNIVSSTQGTYAGTGTIYPTQASYNSGTTRLGIGLDPNGFTWDAGSQVLGSFQAINPSYVTSASLTIPG